jgi:hypothetical protein
MPEPVFFCDFQISTQENDRDCIAHCNQRRVFACPYPNAEEAKWKCVDFEPFKSRSREV